MCCEELFVRSHRPATAKEMGRYILSSSLRSSKRPLVSWRTVINPASLVYLKPTLTAILPTNHSLYQSLVFRPQWTYPGLMWLSMKVGSHAFFGDLRVDTHSDLNLFLTFARNLYINVVPCLSGSCLLPSNFPSAKDIQAELRRWEF